MSTKISVLTDIKRACSSGFDIVTQATVIVFRYCYVMVPVMLRIVARVTMR